MGEKVGRIMNAVDTNQNGILDYGEIRTVCAHRMLVCKETRVKAIFRKILRNTLRENWFIIDDSGKPFYQNNVTGRTKWDPESLSVEEILDFLKGYRYREEDVKKMI